MAGGLSAKPGDLEGTRLQGHAEEGLVLGLDLGRRFTFEKQQIVEGSSKELLLSTGDHHAAQGETGQLKLREA